MKLALITFAFATTFLTGCCHRNTCPVLPTNPVTCKDAFYADYYSNPMPGCTFNP